MKQFFLVGAFVASLCLFTATTVRAQGSEPPNGQFGIGAFIVGTGEQTPPGGLTFAYALNRQIHLGTVFALEAISAGGSETDFWFAPFFQYVIEGPTVSPFFQGSFSILSAGGTTFTSFNLGGGLMYYWNQHFGVHADLDVISLGLSPSPTTTVFGFFASRVGVEWYFNK